MQQQSRVILYFNSLGRTLTHDVVFVAKTILEHSTYKCCKNSDSNLIVAISYNVDTTKLQSDEVGASYIVSNTIDDAIRYTSSLDLLRRPRLSRLNADRVVLHRKHQASKYDKSSVVFKSSFSKFMTTV